MANLFLTLRFLKQEFNVKLIFLSGLLLFSSCSDDSKKAKRFLQEAETALSEKNYPLAKLKIDSIKLIYPKDYKYVNAGFQLMQRVRMEENNRNIAYCDSMLAVDIALLQNMLTKFNYVRDEQYQEFGNYIPKIYPSDRALSQKTLRSGVSEKGTLYIESILPGGNLKHNKIKISTKDGSFAETLPVTSDGLNYRFNTVAGSYEIVRFAGADENGIANFIFTFKEQPLSITYIGAKNLTASLAKAAAEGISQSFELSNILLEIEKLKFEKEKSEALIRYLEERKK
ncbi:MAG: hypothetical protein LBS52_09340 [Dysgonamonadaceae bacterium]|jgi:hypothetical protein|nr:hypothetical protein [Dysgonamonadaceae bacterium]